MNARTPSADDTTRRKTGMRARLGSLAARGCSTAGSITYSIIIPVFNEEESLPQLFPRLDALRARLMGATEVIFIDDGSRDRSIDLIRTYTLGGAHLRLVALSRNFGHQAALTAGYDAAQGAAVISMDADLQDPPEVVDRLVERWRQGFEIVYAIRSRRHGEGVLKKVSAHIFYRLLAALTGMAMPVDCGDFRLLDRQAVDALARVREHHRYLRGLVAWIGFRHATVAYERPARAAGTTSYTWRRMLALAADGLISCSHLPLRLALAAGVALLGGCILAVAGMVLLHGAGHHCPGWTAPLLVTSGMGGIQLIALGIACAYIQRIHDDARHRPLYLARAGDDAGIASVAVPGHATRTTARLRRAPRAQAVRRRPSMTPFGSRVAPRHR